MGALRSDTLRDIGRGVAIAAVAGVFLALSGAFVGPQTPLPVRLIYWIPLMIGGALWGQVCGMLTRRWIDPAERPWLAAAVMSILLAGPMTVVVWAVTGWVFEGRPHPLSHLPAFLMPVVVITSAMCVMMVFTSHTRTLQTHAAAPGAAPARFLDRLPPKLRGARLIAVQAEDHYLRLHTDRGSDLILMRLSDAVAELEGLEGAQVHRSWWAAREAVRDVSRGDGRAVLTLEGDLKVPVSRVHARRLRAEGWW